MFAIIDRLKYYLTNISIALVDSAFEYDAKLKLTKPPLQRIIIWLSILLLLLVILTIFGVTIKLIFAPILNNVLPA